MKPRHILATLLMSACGAATDAELSASRVPAGFVDLVPKSFSFRIINSRQFVTLRVENRGNRQVLATDSQILFNGRPALVRVSAIAAHGEGTMEFALSPNTIRHCQRVAGHIDLKRELQFGNPLVFTNDNFDNLFWVDVNALRVCIEPVSRQ